MSAGCTKRRRTSQTNIDGLSLKSLLSNRLYRIIYIIIYGSNYMPDKAAYLPYTSVYLDGRNLNYLDDNGSKGYIFYCPLSSIQ